MCEGRVCSAVCDDLCVCEPQDMGPHIFQTCPSANYFDCKAMSIGARSQSARTYLERHMDKFLDCTSRASHHTSAFYFIRC